ncbi:MAG: protein kinase [Planctomycetota bacterium]|nr:protein kinase [Planctomycetota bacterium]
MSSPQNRRTFVARVRLYIRNPSVMLRHKRQPGAELRRAFDSVHRLPREEQRIELERLDRSQPQLALKLRKLLAIPPEETHEPEHLDLSKIPEGTVVGSYVLSSCVACNDNNAIYLARDPHHASLTVAIKLRASSRAGSDSQTDAERDEPLAREHAVMEAARRHRLPGFPEALGKPFRWEFGGVPLCGLARTWVEGELIATWSRKRRERSDVTSIVRMLESLCQVVGGAHNAGIAHGDLKPANIIVTPEQCPVLLDFDSSWLRSWDSQRKAAAWGGTVQYQPPDRRESLSQPTPSSDVYSLGVIAYELVTGRTPDSVGRADSLGLDISPALCEICPDAKGPVEQIVIRALQESSLRYRGAMEMAGHLRLFLDGKELPAPPRSLLRDARTLVARHRVPAALALAVALTLAVATSISLAMLRQTRAAERATRDTRDALVGLATVAILDTDDTLSWIPGTTAVRNAAAQRSIEYLAQVTAKMDDDPRMRRLVAEARVRLAESLSLGWKPHLGRLDEAHAQLRLALAEYERLYRENPGDPDVRRGLAKAQYLRLASTPYPEPGGPPQFLAELRSVLSMLKGLYNQGDRSAETLSTLANVQMQIVIETWKHAALDAEQIRRGFQTCLDYLDQMPASTNPALVGDARVRMLRHEALVLRKAAYPGALAAAESAWKLASTLAASEQPPGWHNQQACIVQVERAHSLALSDPRTAIDEVRRATQRANELHSLDPIEFTMRRTWSVLPAMASEVLVAAAAHSDLSQQERRRALELAAELLGDAAERVERLRDGGGLRSWESNYLANLRVAQEDVLRKLGEVRPESASDGGR